MKDLQEHRKKIDALDDRIVELLGQRYAIVREVGRIKADRRLDLIQTARVEEVLARVAVLARAHGLDEGFVQALYTLMIDHAHDLERQIGQDHAAA